jgi:hypothetical protein
MIKRTDTASFKENVKNKVDSLNKGSSKRNTNSQGRSRSPSNTDRKSTLLNHLRKSKRNPKKEDNYEDDGLQILKEINLDRNIRNIDDFNFNSYKNQEEEENFLYENKVLDTIGSDVKANFNLTPFEKRNNKLIPIQFNT